MHIALNINNLKISIITVAYNAVDTIAGTIESVLSQIDVDIEYIIVDGNSEDGTKDIIKTFAKIDSRIKWISESDSGLYDAMNKGIERATGEWIHLLNADDVYFEPWSSDFGVKTNKKVNVVVSEQQEEDKPRLTVEVFQQEEPIFEGPKVKIVEAPKPKEVESPKKKIVESIINKPEMMVVKTKNGLKLQITKEQFLRNFGNLK